MHAPAWVSAPVTRTRSLAVSPGLSCVTPLLMRVTTFHGAGASPPTVAAGGGAAGAGFGFGVGFGAAATTGAGFGVGFRGAAAAACDLGSPRALASLSLQNSALRTSVSSRSATFASSFLIRPSAVSRLRCASSCASLAPAAAAPLRRITRPRIGTSSGVKMSPSRRSKSRTSASGRASFASASVLQAPPSRAVTLQRTGSARCEGERSCADPMNEAAAPAAAAALSMAARAAAAPARAQRNFVGQLTLQRAPAALHALDEAIEA